LKTGSASKKLAETGSKLASAIKSVVVSIERMDTKVHILRFRIASMASGKESDTTLPETDDTEGYRVMRDMVQEDLRSPSPGIRMRARERHRLHASVWREKNISFSSLADSEDGAGCREIDPLPSEGLRRPLSDTSDYEVVETSPWRKSCGGADYGLYTTDDVTEPLEQAKTMLRYKEELDRSMGVEITTGSTPMEVEHVPPLVVDGDGSGDEFPPASAARSCPELPKRARSRSVTTGKWQKKKEARQRWREAEARRLGLLPLQRCRWTAVQNGGGGRRLDW